MHPESLKSVAQSAVYSAVKRGELVRPETCEGCGASGRIEGHHPDYTKPLEVEWLCPACHRSRHPKEPSSRHIDWGGPKKTVRVNMRLPVEIWEAVGVAAEQECGGNRSLYVRRAVERHLEALEAALGSQTGDEPTRPASVSRSPVSPRASERDRAFEQFVSEGRPFRCPVSDCEWPGAGSPTARCPHHARTVVPRGVTG